MSANHFADRLVERIAHVASPLCVGLDPHLQQIPAEFGVRPEQPASEDTSGGVRRFFSVVLEACEGRVAIVKPQSAFFEQMGFRGIRVLEEVVAEARQRGLLVLMDAKRGDIGSTAAAYARTYCFPNSPCRADALTLNPYLGLDSLEPFLEASRLHGVGLFVLARTSNPGARDFQDRRTDGLPLYQQVARALKDPAESLLGASGWSNLGVVAGATYPLEARQLREALAHSPFLVPGYGAQGASLEQTLAGFVARGARLEGGIVSSSRGILFGTPGSSEAYRQGLVERLDVAGDELGRACGLRAVA